MCQGDPYSPFIFILCVEALSLIFKRKVLVDFMVLRFHVVLLQWLIWCLRMISFFLPELMDVSLKRCNMFCSNILIGWGKKSINANILLLLATTLLLMCCKIFALFWGFKRCDLAASILIFLLWCHIPSFKLFSIWEIRWSRNWLVGRQRFFCKLVVPLCFELQHLPCHSIRWHPFFYLRLGVWTWIGNLRAFGGVLGIVVLATFHRLLGVVFASLNSGVGLDYQSFMIWIKPY